MSTSYTGNISYILNEYYVLDQVVFDLDRKKISFDFKDDGNLLYTVVLNQQKSGYWEGSYQCKGFSEKVRFELFKRLDGSYLLNGIWKEDGDLYQCFIIIDED